MYFTITSGSDKIKKHTGDGGRQRDRLFTFETSDGGGAQKRQNVVLFNQSHKASVITSK